MEKVFFEIKTSRLKKKKRLLVKKPHKTTKKKQNRDNNTQEGCHMRGDGEFLIYFFVFFWLFLGFCVFLFGIFHQRFFCF